MNIEERNQLFEEYYAPFGKRILFQLTSEPDKETGTNTEKSNPTQESSTVDEFRKRYAFRLKNKQISDLPPILQDVVMVAEDDNMAATLYLGALGVLSACLPNVKGSWFNNEEQSNLYVFLTGSAATGKGRMNLCRYLAEPISDQCFAATFADQKLWEKHNIPLEQRQSQSHSGDKLQHRNSLHSSRRLFIPANSSSSAMYEDLARNNGAGILFETEADTLSSSLRRGDFTDVLRKAFHGETTSMRRRTNDENIYVEHPYLSIVISGTPAQASRLLHSAENGLFSRFIFYRLDQDMTLKSSQGHNDGKAIRLYFTQLGYRVLKLYKKLKDREETQFLLTDNQREMLENHIGTLRNKYVELFTKAYGTDEATDAAFSIGNRMGIIAFRILMIRSLMRYVDHERLPKHITCNETDFLAVLYDIETLFQQSHIVFDDMILADKKYQDDNTPEIHLENEDCLSIKQRTFYNKLPESFKAQESITIAQELGLLRSAAYRYLETFCELGIMTKVRRGLYKKQ